jgi:hypothetical protein
VLLRVAVGLWEGSEVADSNTLLVAGALDLAEAQTPGASRQEVIVAVVASNTAVQAAVYIPPEADVGLRCNSSKGYCIQTS